MQRVVEAKPKQPHYKVALKNKQVYCFPESYMSGFADKLFVITTNDLKKTANQTLANLCHDDWLFKRMDGNDFSSIVADLKRSLRIMVEVGDGDTYHLQTAYDASELNLNDEQREALGELSDHDYLQHLYFDGLANLQQHEDSNGITYEKFKNVASAYMQQHIYFIKNIIQSGISDNLLIADFSIKCDLIFQKDGGVVLDLYQPNCSIKCMDIQNKGDLLSAPCPSQVFIRIPYLAKQKHFGFPIIFCNEYFLPFIFSDQPILLQEKPEGLETEQKAQLESAISQVLKNKSEGAEKVKRQATKGRHAVKIILSSAGLLGIAAVATILLIPSGPGALVALVGLAAADGAVSTGLSIGAAFTIFGISTAAGAGLSSSIYFTCRAIIPRTLEQIDISNALYDTPELIHTDLSLSVDKSLESFVSLEYADENVEKKSPPASPNLFRSRPASPLIADSNDKGKEEISSLSL